MTSKELVIKTLEFEKPERIARQLWSLPWAQEHFPAELSRIQRDFPDDITGAPLIYKQPPKTAGDQYGVGNYVDEWGCVFENKEKGIIGQVKHPLVKTWDDLDKMRLPQEVLTLDISQVNEFCQNTDKFVMGGCLPRLFERMQFIRGTENLMMDIALHCDEFGALLKKVHEFYLEEMQLWAKTNVDGLFFMDDWGAQRSLLIRPQTWRDIFKPLYKDYVDIAHSHGKKIFMHSDGYITEIIPDLIEIGVDALNSQIFCMGVKELGSQYKGQITFWGEIDRQHILPNGNENDIVSAVELVKDSLFQDGGVIAQCEFGPGANPDNVYKVFETWSRL